MWFASLVAFDASGVWVLGGLMIWGGVQAGVSVLVKLDPHQMIDSELDRAGLLSAERRPDANRCEQWIREGNRPPPIEVLENR